MLLVSEYIINGSTIDIKQNEETSFYYFLDKIASVCYSC